MCLLVLYLLRPSSIKPQLRLTWIFLASNLFSHLKHFFRHFECLLNIFSYFVWFLSMVVNWLWKKSSLQKNFKRFNYECYRIWLEYIFYLKTFIINNNIGQIFCSFLSDLLKFCKNLTSFSLFLICLLIIFHLFLFFIFGV